MKAGLYILIFAFCVNFVSEVWAYQCKQPVDFQEEVDRSSMIVIGKIKKIKKLDSMPDPYPYQVTLEIIQEFKGPGQKELDVYFNSIGGGEYPCLELLQDGAVLLVYAQGVERLTTQINTRGVTSQCSRTNVLSEVDADLKLLAEKFNGIAVWQIILD